MTLCSGFRVYPYKVRNVSILYNYRLNNLSLAEYDEIYGTYHSLQDVIKVIESEQDRTHKVRELLNMFYAQLRTPLPKPKGRKYPYVVLEGIEHAGRKPLALHMVNTFTGKYIENPPAIIRSYYPSLMIHTPRFRRAYYVLGNYLAAHYAKQVIHSMPVFMDRCWHSITAFSIAKTFCKNRTKLPLPQSPIYRWPDDLLKPDIIFFLKITRRSIIKNVRDKLAGKKQSRIFRIMSGQAHEEFIDPGVITVDANNKKKYIYRILKFTLKELFDNMGVKG